MDKIRIKKYEYTDMPGWSYSKGRMLRECPRRYWLHYYGIKFGDAKISKEVSRIKKLTSLPLEVGKVIHETIAQSLRHVMTKGEYPSIDKLVLHGHNTLKIYLENKQFLEEEIGDGFDVKKIANTFEQVKEGLTTFEHHPLLPEIVTSLKERPNTCLIDPTGYGECRIDGKKAYAKPDLVYKDDKSQIKVIDWKIGNGNRKENMIQLGGYLLYAKDVLDYQMDELEGRIIYLSPPQDDLILKPTEDNLNMIRKRISREIECIERCCIDPHNNIPKSMKNFPKTMDSRFCLFCNYKHVCNE